ncbi:MAG: hypothetical protein J0M18_17350 [Ignavibacteria bacterium]|nr:hypothetical protein [Ignavibacteria bacterium]
MENKEKQSNLALTKGTTPENLTASLDKEHNSAEPLHTSQANRDDIKELKGGTPEDKPESNSNIENYLGSEKLDEKLSTQTEKHQGELRQSEEDKNANNKVPETPDVL